MNLLKKIYGLLLGIVICVIIFQIENKGMLFGKFVNRFNPCVQGPMNSFPCYGSYDIGMMALAIIVGLILVGIIISIIVQRNK